MTEGAIIKYLNSQKYKHLDLLKLEKDFVYIPATNHFDITQIPAGFETDNASVPDYLVWLIHPNDKRIREASWFHDYVARNQKTLQDKYNYDNDTLRQASNVEMCKKSIENGLPKIKAYLIYFALQFSKKAKTIWQKRSQQ